MHRHVTPQGPLQARRVLIVPWGRAEEGGGIRRLAEVVDEVDEGWPRRQGVKVVVSPLERRRGARHLRRAVHGKAIEAEKDEEACYLMGSKLVEEINGLENEVER